MEIPAYRGVASVERTDQALLSANQSAGAAERETMDVVTLSEEAQRSRTLLTQLGQTPQVEELALPPESAIYDVSAPLAPSPLQPLLPPELEPLALTTEAAALDPALAAETAAPQLPPYEPIAPSEQSYTPPVDETLSSFMQLQPEAYSKYMAWYV